jgi:hypothetical protein
METSNKYSQYIFNLKAATTSQKLKWTQENPTTYYARIISGIGDEAIISIQKPGFDDYIFQIKNISKGEVIVTIATNSIDYLLIPEIKYALKDLYESIVEIFDKGKFDFLDDLLGQIK